MITDEQRIALGFWPRTVRGWWFWFLLVTGRTAVAAEAPMITAIAHAPDGTRIILLGVTRENIDRLLAGKPIRVSAQNHPGFPTDLVISIAFGEDEHALTEMLKPFLSEETKIVSVPRKKGRPQ